MRLLCLLLRIGSFLTGKAQWEKMPIGTKLYYECKYTFIHSEENGSEDSVRGTKSISLTLDTIISLNGQDRKLILFSDDFDPSGIDYVNIPKKYGKGEDNLNSKMCTLFYCFKHAIYGLYVSKQIKELFRKKSFITALDDSLNQAVYYAISDTMFSNYQVKYKGDNPYYWIRIQGCEINFSSFQFLLKEIHKKSSENYSGEDPYFDFYGYYKERAPKKYEYVLAKKNINSRLIYSPVKGFLQSKTDAAFHGRDNRAVTEMKLEKIAYPQ
ncbi:hypothetical protein SAMN05192529_11125 [Arachidicoccus rhizosphaerae]|uniref:Uncharacterized protein n=1 Tax=Arachidicoccus rhizosphaerae TaxID=551991 RepID=A0A1H3ZGR7_9BACT|nr:hypothetical protein [Arachidicoccus rhizosphaerae]SEA22976.1 hypothetical protein SAMN05192529_11125 [Arachidicoccus rhizosphaerae]